MSNTYHIIDGQTGGLYEIVASHDTPEATLNVLLEVLVDVIRDGKHITMEDGYLLLSDGRLRQARRLESLDEPDEMLAFLRPLVEYWEARLPTPDPEPQPDPDDAPPIFGQRNEPWAPRRYTEESYNTFHDYGCFVVALTSLVAWVGYDVDPLIVASALDEHDAFDGSMLMRPQVLSEVYPALGDYQRIDWSGPADIAWLQAQLKRGPVVVQLDFKPSWALESHFVLAYDYQPDPDGGRHDSLMVMDPWDAAYLDAAADVETNAAGKRNGGGYFWSLWWTGRDMDGTDKTRVERILWGARHFSLEV